MLLNCFIVELIIGIAIFEGVLVHKSWAAALLRAILNVAGHEALQFSKNEESTPEHIMHMHRPTFIINQFLRKMDYLLIIRRSWWYRMYYLLAIQFAINFSHTQQRVDSRIKRCSLHIFDWSPVTMFRDILLLYYLYNSLDIEYRKSICKDRYYPFRLMAEIMLSLS